MSFLQKYLRKTNILLALSTAMLISGCAGPKIDSDLLTQPKQLAEPMVESSYTITAEINPKINNYEKIDNSVKESLIVALDNANIFGDNDSRKYRINANVEVASQSAWGFGNFEGKLQVKYTIFDQANYKVLEKTIYTEAGSDQWYFSGAKRHRRARAVNITKNVLAFTNYLKSNLNTSVSAR